MEDQNVKDEIIPDVNHKDMFIFYHNNRYKECNISPH